MEQITRGELGRVVVRVGVDLAKRVIHVHAVDAAGRVIAGRALGRDKFVAWCAQLPPGCVVAMESNSSAHHWARKLIALGLDARIISAQLVAPYRLEGVTGKNDANDAEADQVKQAATLMGVGPVTASAAVATVGDIKQFRNGAQFAAWIGLTPRRRPSPSAESTKHVCQPAAASDFD